MRITFSFHKAIWIHFARRHVLVQILPQIFQGDMWRYINQCFFLERLAGWKCEFNGPLLNDYNKEKKNKLTKQAFYNIFKVPEIN